MTYCVNCGTRAEPSGRFCVSCGAALSVATPSAATGGKVHSEAATTGAYAGFGVRVLATVIDSMLMLIALVLVGAFIGLTLGDDMDEKNIENLITGLTYLAMPICYVLMESSSWQGTPGKRWLGIKVTDMQGRRITLGRAIGRYISRLADMISLGFGLLLCLFTRRHQTLHDMLAGTFVLSSDAAEDDPRLDAPITRKSPKAAVALGVLLAPLCFVPLLAAIGIPAYSDYLVRARVTEAVNFASSAKSAFAEAYLSRGFVCTSNEECGLPADIETTGARLQIIDNSRILMEIKEPNADTSLGTIIFQAYQDTDSTGATTGLIWDCTGGSLPPRLRPSSCRP